MFKVKRKEAEDGYSIHRVSVQILEIEHFFCDIINVTTRQTGQQAIKGIIGQEVLFLVKLPHVGI